MVQYVTLCCVISHHCFILPQNEDYIMALVLVCANSCRDVILKHCCIQITKQLNGLVTEATQPFSPAHGHHAMHWLRDLTPALTQYSRLVQFYLTQHVAAVRAMAKLQSILLSVFATIAQKVTDQNI